MIRTRKPNRNRLALLGACAAMTLPGVSRAGWTWDPSVSDGSWSVLSNWLGGPSGSTDVSVLFNDAANHDIVFDSMVDSNSPGGTTLNLSNTGAGQVTLSIPSTTHNGFIGGSIYVGSNGQGIVDQSGYGVGDQNTQIILGQNAGGAGTYLLSGGRLNAYGRMTVGSLGIGYMGQSGGAATLELEVNQGTYALSGGSLTTLGETNIDFPNAGGKFIQSGGTHLNIGSGEFGGLIVGPFTTGNPDDYVDDYLLSGGTLITSSEWVIGYAFTQTGGVHKVGTSAVPAYIVGGYTLRGGTLNIIGNQFGANIQSGGTVNLGAPGGTSSSTMYADIYQLSDGVINIIGSLTLGSTVPTAASFASFAQSGGTNNLGTSSNPGTLILADDYQGRTTNAGTYALNGDPAVMNVIGNEYVGLGGGGSFLQSAGTHALGTESSPSQLYVGHDSKGKGLYKLSGGTFLARGTEFVGYDGLGTFAVSGSGLHVLTGNMYLGGSDTLASATGKGTLTVSGGALNISGMLKLWNSATASYSGGSMNLGALDVGGGLFRMVAGKSRVLRTGSISTSSGGKVDLNDNSIIVDYPDGGPSQESSIAAQIQSGYANGAWNGPGITSSIAASDPTRRIGYADNALLLKDSFNGEPVDSSSVLVKLTYGGDTNLDDVVNVADLEALAQNWNQSGDWLEGDFDYNGTVDLADLKILALNWNAGDSLTASETSLGLPIVVPEPSLGAFAVIAFCTGLTSSRRRRANPITPT